MKKTKNTPPEEHILYHYTSMSVLFKVLEGINPYCVNCKYYNVDCDKPAIAMYATHAAFMNDPTDTKHLFKHFTDNGRQLRIAEEYQKMFGEPFVFSLSKSKNQGDELPMWNTYGQQGKGIAIGFDMRELKKLIGGWMLCECQYPTSDEIDKLPKYNELKEAIKKSEDDPNEIIVDPRMSAAIRLSKQMLPCSVQQKDGTFVSYTPDKESFEASKYLAVMSAILKHCAYKYEKEWRLFGYFEKPEFKNFVKYRERNGIVIPYVEIHIPFRAIKEIIIGPTVDKQRAKKLLELLRLSKGITKGIDIHPSNIPYTCE